MFGAQQRGGGHGRGGYADSSSAGAGSPAPRPSAAATPALSAMQVLSSPKSALQRLGLIKPPPAELSVERARELDRLEAAQAAFDTSEERIKQRVRAALAANPKAPLTRERAELTQLKLDRAKNDGYIMAIVTQKSHVERRRTDARVLGILSRGNEELQRETDAAQHAYDVGSITGDFDDLVNEGVDDQVEILQGFAQVDPLARLQDVSITTPNGAVSLGDDIDAEFAQLRSEATAVHDFAALEVHEALPTVAHTVRAPVGASSAPQQVFSGGGRTAVALTSSGGWGDAGAPVARPRQQPTSAPRSPAAASTQSPFAARTAPGLSLDADLDWLQ